MRRTLCPARRNDCATSSSPSGSSRKNTFVYIKGPGWTPSTRTLDPFEQFTRSEPEPGELRRVPRPTENKYRWCRDAHAGRFRMTHDWAKLGRRPRATVEAAGNPVRYE